MNKTKSYKELSNLDKEEILNYYYKYKNENFKTIAKKLNVSQRSVPRVLQEYGVNTRLKNRYVIKNENYFENIDTEFKAYALGFIYADGFVGVHNDFCIALSDVHDDNLAFLSVLKEELGITLEIKHGVSKQGYGSYTLKFSNEKIVKDLNKHGVYTCKSLVMTDMPKLKEELYGHFIRGYFDGDGSIYNYFDIYDKRQRWGMEILGTPDFLSKVQKILIKNCNVKETKLHNVNHVKNLTRISYKGIKSLMKIRDFLYENATIYLEYKYKKFYNISPCNW